MVLNSLNRFFLNNRGKNSQENYFSKSKCFHRIILRSLNKLTITHLSVKFKPNRRRTVPTLYIVHDILQTPDAFTWSDSDPNLEISDRDRPFDECTCDASHEDFDKFCYKVDLSQAKEDARNTGWDTQEMPCISIVRSQSRVMPKRAQGTDSFDSLLREQARLILSLLRSIMFDFNSLKISCG